MKTPNEIVHVSRMQEEILLQRLIKNKNFENITVKELRNFAHFAIVGLSNYAYEFETNPRETLLTDEDFSNPLFIEKQLKKI